MAPDIAKHLMKDRFVEGIELVEGAAAKAAEIVRLIQYSRNPPLLFQRREGNWQILNERFWHATLTAAPGHTLLAFVPDRILPEEMRQIASIHTAAWAQNMKLCRTESPFGFDLGNTDLVVFEAWRDLRKKNISVLEGRIALRDFLIASSISNMHRTVLVQIGHG
ncbi:hypothetical protein JP74_12770 [Devosia sp. 17-2-E-8]|nr:hypothetical protein JP74_12770 [Devosia sp. 17-2-E-8]